jgi:hypothetical protein
VLQPEMDHGWVIDAHFVRTRIDRGTGELEILFDAIEIKRGSLGCQKLIEPFDDPLLKRFALTDKRDFLRQRSEPLLPLTDAAI